MVVNGTNYMLLSCNEVTIVDNQSWISIHAYVLVDWERVLLLLSLERLTKGSTAAYIAKVIVNVVVRDGGMSAKEMHDKFVCFGSDGTSMLQGKKNGILVQIQGQHALHCQGMYCIAHRTDLAMEVLSEFEMILTIEKLLKKLYSYFNKSLKRHLELEKLSKLLQSKGRKNIKTQWISMLSPLKRVLSKCRVLLMKMYINSNAKPAVKGTKTNYRRLTNVQTLQSLAAASVDSKGSCCLCSISISLCM